VFGRLFHSPLSRAARTAEIIWGSRSGPVSVLPSLREVDLYSFQVPPIPHLLNLRLCATSPLLASQGAVLWECLLSGECLVINQRARARSSCLLQACMMSGTSAEPGRRAAEKFERRASHRAWPGRL